jgi:hypothetical protein
VTRPADIAELNDDPAVPAASVVEDGGHAASPPTGRRGWLIVVIGIAIGVGVGFGAVVVLDRGSSAPLPATSTQLSGDQSLPPEHRANAIAFMQAWELFRNATFVAQLRFERTVAGKDGSLVSDGTLVQRPPQRVVTGFGDQSSLFGDGAQTCELGADGTEVCAAPRTSEPYDVSVARELSTLSQYFSGDTPLYRVDAPSPGCFRLFLYRSMALAPYGDAAQFCFDAATGAMTLFEKTTDGGRDRVTATNVSAAVTDADFPSH